MSTPTPSSAPTPFRSDIHRLRGVAILLIVAAHCVTFFQWNNHPIGLSLVMDMFDNSTLIFMFISGYLFHHTSANYRYPNYLRSKAFNVLLPYVIAAAPGMLYMLYTRAPSAPDAGTQLSLLGRIADLLLYGGSQVNYALWFIPVICIYYLASPLLVQLARRPALYAVLLLLLPLSVLMHRPTYTHGHNLLLAVYFLSAYLGGMFCSQYHDGIVPLLDRHFGVLCAFTVGLVVAHVTLSTHHGKYNVQSMQSLLTLDRPGGLIDWLFVQKVLITLSLWALIRRFATARMALLDHLADASFTIYFLHLYVIYGVVWLTQQRSIEVSVPAFALLLVAAVVVPTLIAWVARKLAPQWSRSLVGS